MCTSKDVIGHNRLCKLSSWKSKGITAKLKNCEHLKYI